MMMLDRRQAMLRSLFGVGGLGLRAFATGIPYAFLLNPKRAMAAAAAANDACIDVDRAQRIVLATSSSGDPLNGNVPGTYDDAGIVHSSAASMASASIMQSGKATKGAACWNALGPALLNRTAFFHHATYTTVHGQEPGTLRLNGAVRGNEMLVSMLASKLGGCLGTIQTQPVCVGARGGDEMVSYQGRVQPALKPSALASVLTLKDGPMKNLRSMRDETLDQLNAWYKGNATPGQADFLERYANTQSELRNVSDTLLNTLGTIRDDSINSQVLAVSALFQLNVAPVATINLNWGGDNHGDGGLNGEASAHVAAIASINSLFSNLASAKLDSKVTLLGLNVFGRTMAVAHKQQTGRDHNGNHHAALIIGSGIKGGVVGGVAPMGADYGATGIDSASGASTPNGGDVPFAETFAAMGKTVSRAVGLSEQFTDDNITGGKAILSALA